MRVSRTVKAVILARLIIIASLGSAMAWTHGSPVAPPPVTFDGLAATRGTVPTDNSGDTQAMSRLGSFTRAPVTKIKIVTPNWYGGSGAGGETAPGGTATVTASIEYPQGTCTQLTWSSSRPPPPSPNGGQVTSGLRKRQYPDQYAILGQGVHHRFKRRCLGYLPRPEHRDYGRQSGCRQLWRVADQTVSCGTVTDGGTAGGVKHSSTGDHCPDSRPCGLHHLATVSRLVLITPTPRTRTATAVSSLHPSAHLSATPIWAKTVRGPPVMSQATLIKTPSSNTVRTRLYRWDQMTSILTSIASRRWKAI